MKYNYLKTSCYVLLAIGSLSLPRLASAADYFTVKNDSGQAVELWVYRHQLQNWVSFPIGPTQFVRLTPKAQGVSTLVVRTPPRNDVRIGQYDLQSIVATNMDPTILISNVQEMKTVMRTTTDQYGRQTQVSETITTSKPIIDFKNFSK